MSNAEHLNEEVPKLKVGVEGDEELAFQKEFQGIADEVGQIAEEAVRSKNIEEAEEEIGTFKERLKNGTLPEGVRDERDFEEYAEEKRARAREKKVEVVSEAKEKVEKAYEKKEDERTELEKQYPAIVKQLKAVIGQNPEISTEDLVKKVWEMTPTYRTVAWRTDRFGRKNGYRFFAENIDDISKLGVKVDASYLLGRLSGDEIATSADGLAEHGAKLPPHRQEEFFSYGARLEHYDGLAKLGYKKSFQECLEETEGCVGCKTKQFELEREQALVDNLDTILAHGIRIGKVVRMLSPETIRRYYDTLKDHGAVFVNPAKRIAAFRGKRAS